MEWLANNWIWIVFAVGMLAMHMFGHGGHGGHGGRSRHGDHDDGSHPQESKKSVDAEPVAGKVSPHGMTHDHVRLPSDLKSTDGDHKHSERS